MRLIILVLAMVCGGCASVECGPRSFEIGSRRVFCIVCVGGPTGAERDAALSCDWTATKGAAR